MADGETSLAGHVTQGCASSAQTLRYGPSDERDRQRDGQPHPDDQHALSRRMRQVPTGPRRHRQRPSLGAMVSVSAPKAHTLKCQRTRPLALSGGASPYLYRGANAAAVKSGRAYPRARPRRNTGRCAADTITAAMVLRPTSRFGKRGSPHAPPRSLTQAVGIPVPLARCWTDRVDTMVLSWLSYQHVR